MSGTLELPLVYLGQRARMRVSPTEGGTWTVVADLDGKEILRRQCSSWQRVERVRRQLEHQTIPPSSMRRRWPVRAATVFLALVLMAPLTFAQIDRDPNLVFLNHVSDYLTLRSQLRQGVAPEHISDPQIRIISGALLAARIRDARAGATIGDIIPAALADVIRDRLQRAFDPTEIDAILTALYPSGLPSELPRINEHYTYRVAVAPPVSILSALPPLPGVLGYRLIGRALVVWDEEAEMVIDAVLEALPEPHVWEFLAVSSFEIRQTIGDALSAADLDPGALLDAMSRDAKPGARPPAIDQEFDWGAGSMMPPSVLQALPALPAPLEYRIVGSALVVIDVESGYVRGILWDGVRGLIGIRDQGAGIRDQGSGIPFGLRRERSTEAARPWSMRATSAASSITWAAVVRSTMRSRTAKRPNRHATFLINRNQRRT
jgi:hypothetical protein